MGKKTILQLSVTKPCMEGWDKMTPNEKGRHCASCDKTVIDFTLYSDSELVEFFKKATGSVCGHMPRYNLNRPIILTEPSKFSFFHKLAFGTALASWLGIAGTASAQAAKISAKNRTALRHSKQPFITSRAPQAFPNDSIHYIEGTLIDANTRKPLIDSTVSILAKEYVSTMDTLAIGTFKVLVPDSSVQLTALSFTIDTSGKFKAFIPDNLLSKEIILVFNADNHESTEILVTLAGLPYQVFLIQLGSESAISVRGRDATEYIVDGMVCTKETVQEVSIDNSLKHDFDNHLPFVRSYEEGSTDVPLPLPSEQQSKNTRY